ncbi:hypothetical protein A464_2967 [Salmonella bongori N268-08]|uniref:Uncharacterized protein n=1 Tax=Salmonella bongori N268-08 TaxID=1197719 RepID=S5MTT8_SALBN|nr:hypothetical protein A464_2967 [Salmonella bongori N268-08]
MFVIKLMRFILRNNQKPLLMDCSLHKLNFKKMSLSDERYTFCLI